MTSRLTRIQTFAALAEPGFGSLWLGLLLAFFSVSIQSLARGYLAFEITGSAAALGAVLATWGAPMLFLGLIAGVVSDRVSKRDLLMVTQSILGLSSLLTAIVIHLGIVQLWHLLLFGLLQGVAFAFNLPTRQAILPEIVSTQRLSNAVALTQAGASLMNITGPPLAGLLISWPSFGLLGVFYLGAALYGLVVLMLFRLPSLPPKPKSGLSFRAELGAGLTFVRRSPVLPVLLLMQFVPWIVAMPYQQSMPVFAARALGVGPEGLGLLMGGIGSGAFAGAVLVASMATTKWKNRIQLIGGLTFTLGLFAFSFADNLAVSVLLLFVTGAAMSTYASLNNTAIMESTAREFYGRVMSVTSLVMATGPLAVFPYGWVVDNAGPRATVAGSAIFVFSFLVLVMFFRPAMRGRDRVTVLVPPNAPASTHPSERAPAQVS